jgi:hypothetical protein
VSSLYGEHDGNESERPQVDFGATGGLLWHELVLR